MGASGPAFWPFVSYAVLENGGSIQSSFIVVVGLVVVSLVFPAFLCFVGDARGLVDGVSKEAAALVRSRSDVEGGGGGGGGDTLTQIIASRARRRRKESERGEKGGGGWWRFSGSRKEGGGSKEGKEKEKEDGVATPIEARGLGLPGLGLDCEVDRDEIIAEHLEGGQSQQMGRNKNKEKDKVKGVGIQQQRAPWEDQELDTKILEG